MARMSSSPHEHQPGTTLASRLATPGRQLHRSPEHVGVIMDGNGRWAEQRGLPRIEGHRRGVENLRAVLDALARRGVRYVTLYSFSTENWRRPADEVDGIMQVAREAIYQEAEALHQRGVRLIHLGRTDRLDPDLREAVERVQEITRYNDRMVLCVAFDYGGRAELVEAVRRIVAAGIAAEDIDEETIAKYLYTNGIPDPDLIIRTGGEQRLSNFLLWQAAYAEYYYTATLWPDFDEAEVERALQAFGARKRRFGAVTRKS